MEQQHVNMTAKRQNCVFSVIPAARTAELNKLSYCRLFSYDTCIYIVGRAKTAAINQQE
jgi:hypothetical protein